MSERVWWTLLILAAPFLYVLTLPLVEELVDVLARSLHLSYEARRVVDRAFDFYEAPAWALTWLMGYR